MSENIEGKVIIRPNVENYTTARASSGAKSQHNGSFVAVGLEGMTIDEVKQAAVDMGVENVNKYDHLNLGQQRMNLGNRIRGRIVAIDKDKTSALAEAEKDDATKKQKVDAEKMLSGVDSFNKVIAAPRKAVEARAKEAEKAAADKAKEKATKEAAKEAA